jgi:hypothetical protein
VGAKKALKKLKKQHQKTQSNALKQLKMILVRHTESEPIDSVFKQDFKAVTEVTVIKVISELSVPFNPIFSWFNKGDTMLSIEHNTPSVINMPSSPMTLTKKSKVSKSVMLLPLKSPACKRCPALKNGFCKCAIKRFS